MVVDGCEIFQQHEQGLSYQNLFRKHVISLYETILSMGNPLEDDSPELLVLDSHSCTTEGVVDTVWSITTLGLRQYQNYVADVIVDRNVFIHQVIIKTYYCLRNNIQKSLPRVSNKLLV